MGGSLSITNGTYFTVDQGANWQFDNGTGMANSQIGHITATSNFYVAGNHIQAYNCSKAIVTSVTLNTHGLIGGYADQNVQLKFVQADVISGSALYWTVLATKEATVQHTPYRTYEFSWTGTELSGGVSYFLVCTPDDYQSNYFQYYWTRGSSDTTIDITYYQKLTYDYNGGSGSTSYSEVTEGSNITLPSGTRTGYTQGQWKIGTTEIGEAGKTYALNSSATAVAQWTANKYTVTFNKQAGSGGTNNIQCTYGSAMTQITPPARTGYTFSGYYNSTESTATKYYNADGSSARDYDIAGDTALYAHWTAETYTVTLEKNGGTGGTGSVTATYDQLLPTGGTAPSSSGNTVGYAFRGYAPSTSGPDNNTRYYDSGMNPVSGSTWKTASAGAIYALWKKNFEIQYNDGTGNTTNTGDVFYNSIPSLSISLRGRTGYTLNGVYDSQTGGTQMITSTGAYSGGTTAWTLSGQSGLYCQWTANQYTVTFNKVKDQATTPNPSAIQVTYDGKYGGLATSTCVGYILAGWYTEQEGGTEVTSDTTVKITQEQHLYAHWTAKQTTIVFQKGSGSGGTDSTTATYDDSMPKIDPPTYPGYAFVGYFDQQEGGTQYYNSDGSSAHAWDKDQSVVDLYAHWSNGEYTITLDPSITYSVRGTKSLSIKYTESCNYIPNKQAPKADKKTFLGYFRQNGTQILDKSMDPVPSIGTEGIKTYFTSNETLYAHWNDFLVMKVAVSSSTFKSTEGIYVYTSSGWKNVIDGWVFDGNSWKPQSPN